MKDGRTHLAHKAEPAVDLTSGALLALTLQPADQGDTTTMQQTLEEAQSAAREINPQGVEEVVADKGYHSGAVLQDVYAQRYEVISRNRNAGGGSGRAKGRPKSRSGRMRIGDGCVASATNDCRNCGAN